MQTTATLLANNSQPCWMLHVSSVCTPSFMLLGLVVLSLKPVKLLAKCKRAQQLPTFLGVVGQQCCVRLQGASDPTTRRQQGRHLKREFAFFQSLKRLFLPTYLSLRGTLLMLNCKGPYPSSEREIKLRRCLFALPHKREWAVLQLWAWYHSL